MFICSLTFTCRKKVSVVQGIKGSDVCCWERVSQLSKSLKTSLDLPLNCFGGGFFQFLNYLHYLCIMYICTHICLFMVNWKSEALLGSKTWMCQWCWENPPGGSFGLAAVVTPNWIAASCWELPPWGDGSEDNQVLRGSSEAALAVLVCSEQLFKWWWELGFLLGLRAGRAFSWRKTQLQSTPLWQSSWAVPSRHSSPLLWQTFFSSRKMNTAAELTQSNPPFPTEMPERGK